MHDELIRRLNETKTMSIVGMCKNAGKTTMLNWLLHGGPSAGHAGADLHRAGRRVHRCGHRHGKTGYLCP